MGSWVKRWKFIGTKSAWQAANSPVWMPQGQKPLCLIQLWREPFFHFQPLLLPPYSLCRIKNLVIMGGWVKRWNLLNKISLTGCKCSNLNGPGSGMIPLVSSTFRFTRVPPFSLSETPAAFAWSRRSLARDPLHSRMELGLGQFRFPRTVNRFSGIGFTQPSKNRFLCLSESIP